MTTIERDGQMVQVEGTWRLPDHRILPELLDEAARTIATQLLPAGEAGVQKIMMPLLLAGLRMPATDGLEEKTMVAFMGEQAAVYTKHLKNIPLDLLDKAADACVKESPYFPAVADFFRHAQPEIDRRRRQCGRINALIEESRRKASGVVVKKETEEERLVATIKRWRDQGVDVLFGANLKARAVQAERDLAKLKGRPIEEWAWEQTEETKAKTLPPPTIEGDIISSKVEIVGNTADRVIVDEHEPKPSKWQSGEPLYQRRAEEPPPPSADLVPEGPGADFEVEP